MMLGYLNGFYQLGVGVDTYAFHACLFETLLVLVVELVAMVVALLDAVGSIDLLELAAVDECAVEITHAHVVVEVCLLLLHDVDDIIGGGLVHLT